MGKEKMLGKKEKGKSVWKEKKKWKRKREKKL